MSYARSVLVALALFAACKKDTSTTGAPAQEAMGLYAKGFNALLKDPKQMIKEYFDSIPEAGPDPKARLRLFPRQNFATSAIKEARESFDKAKSAAPDSMASLAPAADQAIAAIERVATTYTAAQKYYEAENYKDDQLAKGKELHGQMIAAAKDFNTALGTLEAGLSKIEDEQATQELAKYEGDKSYSYWFRFYNMQAKKFLSAVEAAHTPETLAKLDAAFQPIAAATDALGKFVASKGGKVNTTFNSYADRATSFHATATKLIRLAKEPKVDGAALDRETESLISNYNTLVSMANTLYDVEAAKALN
jgi:hypothetical protein